MLKIFSLINFVIISIGFFLLLSFGVSNKQLVNLSLWPILDQISLPLYLFFYISLGLGVIITILFRSKNK